MKQKEEREEEEDFSLFFFLTFIINQRSADWLDEVASLKKRGPSTLVCCGLIWS